MKASSFPFVLIGGDLRQHYLSEYLISKGYSVTAYGVPSPHGHSSKTDIALEKVILPDAVVVGPVPFLGKDGYLPSACGSPVTPDGLCRLLGPGNLLAGGSIPESVKILCEKTGTLLYDFMSSISLTLFNAALTAEGMISEILSNTPFMLQSTSTLILGYGSCGTILASKLAALGADVTVFDCRAERLALASSFGFKTCLPDRLNTFLPYTKLLVNTIPSPIITSGSLPLLPEGSCLFDLASAPGGIDLSAAASLHLPAFTCPGLPGKYAPHSAGRALGQELLSYLNLER